MKQKTLTPQKAFSRMGLALFVMLVVTTLVQAVCSGVVNVMAMQGNNLYETCPWLIWAISFLPLYVAGVPIGLAMMRRLPAVENPETASLSVGKLLKYLVMSIGVMYAGNLIGTGLSSLFSGGSAENPLLNYVFDNSPLKVIVIVILAPLVEEYIFRKQIIDRLSKYGEGVAIVFSGVTFGLFHGNLFQFFYACGLGMLFAYVYIRTRRLRYTVILHAVINLIGSVLGPWVLSQVDTDVLSSLDPAAIAAMDQETLMAIAPGILLYGLYALLMIGLAIAGVVLLIVNRKKAELRPAAEELPKGQRFKTAYLNVGVVLLTLLCVALTVLVLLQ